MRVQVQIGSKKTAATICSFYYINGADFVPAIDSEDEWVRDAIHS